MSGRPLALALAVALGSLPACHATRGDERPAAQGWHRVARGETLSGIAARYRVTVAELAALNELDNPDWIQVGQLIFLPVSSHRRTPAPIDRAARTLGPARRAPEGPSSTTAAVPRDGGGAGGRGGGLAWPVVAEVSSPFGPRDGRSHDGIDLRVPDGTPVRAAESGVVAYAGDGLRGYGRLLLVDHGGRLVTVYAHNSELLVTEGQHVRRGDVISRSGHTGRVTAPHLHFEVREDGVPRDPRAFLVEIPDAGP